MSTVAEERKVCIIIVSYNFEPWLHVCLSSIYASSIAATVVVIDNNSADNTVKIIQNDYPDVVLIKNNHNLGFGQANNLGFRYALDNEYDYIFLLNQDAWIEHDTLEKLIRAHENSNNFGVISPVHFAADGETLDHGFVNYTQIDTKDKLDQGDELKELTFINAAFWLIPIDVIKSVGGFSSMFFHYGEDRNYLQRVSYHKYKIGYLSSAFAYHDRLDRVVSNQAFLNAEYVYFLSELTNVHYSLVKSIAYSSMAAIKKAFIEIGKGKFQNAVAYIRMSFKLLSKAITSEHHKRMTKIRGSHYL